MKRVKQPIQDLGLVFKGKERRGGKRYDVRCDAILDVRFPDFHGQIDVTVANFSAGGALLHSQQLTVDTHHLVVSDTKPELTLRIPLPERTLDLTTTIAWYNVSNKNGIFEIGVNFLHFKEESNMTVDELFKIMRKNK